MAQKHIDSLRLFDLVIETKSVPVVTPEESHPGWSPKGPNKKPEQDPLPIHPVNQAFDDLLVHALSHFPSSKDGSYSMMAEFNRILGIQSLDGHEVYELMKSDPESIPEMLWPPLLVRTLLARYAMPINHKMVKTWSQFHDEHGQTILSMLKKYLPGDRK